MDERLECLSDQVRKGITIDFWEAIEVIEYQSKLKLEREEKKNKTVLGRFKKWLLFVCVRRKKGETN